MTLACSLEQKDAERALQRIQAACRSCANVQLAPVICDSTDCPARYETARLRQILGDSTDSIFSW